MKEYLDLNLSQLIRIEWLKKLYSEPENNSCMVLKRFYEEHISKCKKGVKQGLAHDKCLTTIIYL